MRSRAALSGLVAAVTAVAAATVSATAAGAAPPAAPVQPAREVRTTWTNEHPARSQQSGSALWHRPSDALQVRVLPLSGHESCRSVQTGEEDP